MKLAALAFAIFCIIGPAQAPPVPKFDQFPSPVYRGPVGHLRLSSPDAYSRRTRLRTDARQPVNFAGHFQVVTWGCGTYCITGAVIDTLTGRVTFLPTVSTDGVVAMRDDDKFQPIEFRADSPLIIFSGQLNDTGAVGAHFFMWRGIEFRRVDFIAYSPPKSAPAAQDDANADAAAKLGCWSIADTALRVECIKRADDIDAYSANVLALSAICDLPKRRDKIIQYARERGESEYEFAARLKSSIYGIEKLACMAEAGGTTALQSLENFAVAKGDSTSPNNSAATSLPPDFPQHDVNADCRELADRHFAASDRNAAGVLRLPQLQKAWNQMFNACIVKEQIGYDYLKSVWADLPDEVKKQCDYWPAHPESKFYMYHILSTCIQARYHYYQEAHERRSLQK